MSDLGTDLDEIFRDETMERLAQMDTALLAVESGDSSGEPVDALFRHAHTIKGTAAMLGLDDIRVLAHAVEDVLAEVRARDLFPRELAGPLLRATTALRAQVAGTQDPVDELISDLAASLAMLRDTGPAAPPDIGTSAAADIGPAAPADIGTAAPPDSTHENFPADRGGREEEPPNAAISKADQRPLRVPAAKIDHLLDVVGELMQYRGRIEHSLADRQLPREINEALDGSGRMLDELKDIAVGMRTLPLSAMTGRLPRAVRDLARAAGKDVDFVVAGADTEIDRVILESLHEPLTHLLRNAVIHGIESPADRARANKPARGRLEVRAVPRGSQVEIVIADDGGGVSPEVIEEARREGSLASVLARAGYSTAAEVTDLAGRGVGLDAVKTYAQSLGGSLEIRSEPGRGTDVVLLLPLALALLEVLLFVRGGAVYGVPLAAVEEAVPVSGTLMLEGRPALEVRGQPLPLADLASIVGALAPPLSGGSPALVISAGGRRTAVACDAVLGQEEVVVKPLGPLLDGAQGYLGAAILGDGRIALLIEPARLTEAPRRAPELTAPADAGHPGVPKILVVEDSFAVRELQRGILEAAGYPVVTARDGRDALLVLGRDADIALVITDIEMPDLDGFELTRTIRADQARSSLPVVIVSSHGTDDDRHRGAEAGADAFMAKQAFDQQALLATVDRLVGR